MLIFINSQNIIQQATPLSICKYKIYYKYDAKFLHEKIKIRSDHHVSKKKILTQHLKKTLIEGCSI